MPRSIYCSNRRGRGSGPSCRFRIQELILATFATLSDGMAHEDDEIMKSMTPEQRECFLAGLDRAQEIRDQIGALLKSELPDWDRGDRILDLTQEHDELHCKLERMITPGWEPETPPFDYTAIRLSHTLLREQREPTAAESAILLGYSAPTATEIALMELAERLAEKHGDASPDFEAFYRWRGELESRIASRESGGEDRG